MVEMSVIFSFLLRLPPLSLLSFLNPSLIVPPTPFCRSTEPYSAVGKRTIALRLKRYLRFFHGAKCKAFDLSKLGGGQDLMTPLEPLNTCSLRKCDLFFDQLRNFLENTEGDPGQRSCGGGLFSHWYTLENSLYICKEQKKNFITSLTQTKQKITSAEADEATTSACSTSM